MSPNGARKAPSASPPNSQKSSFVDPAIYDKLFTEKDRKPLKIKVRKPTVVQSNPGNWKENEVTKVNGKERSPSPESPLVNQLDEKTLAAFPTGRPFEDKPDIVHCKHCKRPVLRSAAATHIKDCLTKKQEKLKKKKEAKEAKDAAAREKKGEKVETNGDDADGSQSKGARKHAVKGEDADSKKGKKRKADADGDKQPNAKKKKKDEPKAKTSKPKGPVDVERQCGVQLPNGGQCARSLTCKSHSMGLKRGVPGRSLPYDVLLQQYQKKNQAKQQRAAIEANAPLVDDVDAAGGPIDSDEEKEAVMAAIARSNPQPMVTRTFVSTRNKYQYIRMKEMLRNALGGSRGLGASMAGNAAAMNGGGTGPAPIDTNIAAHLRGSLLSSSSLASAGPDNAFGGFASPSLSTYSDAASRERRQSNATGQGGQGPRQILPGQLPGPGSRKPSIAAGGA